VIPDGPDPRAEEFEPDREPVVIATHDEPFSVLRRRILRGSIWVFGGKVVTIVLAIVMNAMLARLLTPNELGAYFTSYTLVVIGGAIAPLGLDRTVVRFASSAIGADQFGRARTAIRMCLRYGAVGAFGAGLLLILGVGDWLALDVLHSPLVASVMPLAAGWLVVTALQALFVETFRALQRFDLATILDEFIVDVLTASLLGALLLARGGASVHTVMLVSLCTTCTAALLGGGLLLGRVRGLHGTGTISRQEVFAFAWPALITNLAIVLLGRGVDLWVLGAIRGQSEVAIYGAASRLVVLVATPFLIVQGVIPPIAAELYAQGRVGDMERALRGAASLAGLPAFLVLIVFILFGQTIMRIGYGPYYEQGTTALILLSIGRLVAVWTGSCSIVLMMTGHQKTVMTVTLISGAISILLGILAARTFGFVGIAVTTSVTLMAQNVVQLLLAHRYVGIWTQIYLSPRKVWQFLTGGGLHGLEDAAR
jgi:O-antigen/teichoic acid export membrane protein